MTNQYNNKQRLTQRQKDANDKQWYKDQIDQLDSRSFGNTQYFSYGGVSEYKRKKVNYDLFNNIVNIQDFEYVCQPYGANVGELPANFTNRDILSTKIKVLLGMEMSMPFSWKVFAVNEEATTRREQEEFGRIRQYVVDSIMAPIKEQAEINAKQESTGKPLTPEELSLLQQKMQAEIESKTPDEVKRYMLREHQDPAEELNQQILQYLVQKERLNDKFNVGWKHNLIAGEEIYCVGIVNGEPTVRVVNPLFFDYEKSADEPRISKGEWAVEELHLTPSEIVTMFGSDLTEEEIDRVYEYRSHPTHVYDADFTFNERDDIHSPYTIRVIHGTWKSLMKIGFLTFRSPVTGKEEMMIVDENYTFNRQNGDLHLKWEWIPQAHETYKILDNIYSYCRPVPGQSKNLDNLWECDLPYFGQPCDNMNSAITSAVDRAKSYQYLYDIIFYRIELLMASDKGKMLGINLNAIPKSAGIDLKKFMYFMEANKLAVFNPREEANKGGGTNIGEMVKEIDMSLVSQIDRYIQLAEYIERKCGESIGVNKNMEGATAPREAVRNTQQNIIQSTHVIRPYFEAHNTIKRDVLEALLECGKVAYSRGKPRKLSYILDDLSLQTLAVNQDMLSNNSMGIFVANSSKSHEARQAVENFAQAALQNQQIELGDLLKVIRSESIMEAEEMLEVAQANRQAQLQEMEQAKIQGAKELEASRQQFERDKWEHEINLARVKEQERRETQIVTQTIFSLGFDPNKDTDDDGTPDVLEVAKFGVDADIKRKKQALDEQRFQHEQQVDAEKLKLDKEKIKIQSKKKVTK